MKEQSDLDAWRPALSQSMRELAGGGRTVLKILELCAGCKSVSAAAAKEARETFGVLGWPPGLAEVIGLIKSK